MKHQPESDAPEVERLHDAFVAVRRMRFSFRRDALQQPQPPQRRALARQRLLVGGLGAAAAVGVSLGVLTIVTGPSENGARVRVVGAALTQPASTATTTPPPTTVAPHTSIEAPTATPTPGTTLSTPLISTPTPGTTPSTPRISTPPASTPAPSTQQTIPSSTTSTSVGTNAGCAYPAVNSISPTSGPTSGGTTVTIGGELFGSVNKVTFGGVNSPSFTVVSDTEIRAVSPAHAAGSVQVQVWGGGVNCEEYPSVPSPGSNYTYVPS
jgi:hypothetical protein